MCARACVATPRLRRSLPLLTDRRAWRTHVTPRQAFYGETTDEHFVKRKQVGKWVREWARSRGVTYHVGIVGDRDEAGREEMQSGYLNIMLRAKIVVTCSPDYWEGDYRTQEAIASGAVTLVSKHVVPPPNVDPVHEYSSKQELFEKLDSLGAAPASTVPPLRAAEMFSNITRRRRAFVLEPPANNRLGEYKHIMLPAIDSVRVFDVALAAIVVCDVHRHTASACIRDFTKLQIEFPHLKLVVLDWTDHPVSCIDSNSELESDNGECRALLNVADEYWKRSQVDRRSQTKIDFGQKVHQLFYPTKPAFDDAVRAVGTLERDIHVACFFPDQDFPVFASNRAYSSA